MCYLTRSHFRETTISSVLNSQTEDLNGTVSESSLSSFVSFLLNSVIELKICQSLRQGYRTPVENTTPLSVHFAHCHSDNDVTAVVSCRRVFRCEYSKYPGCYEVIEAQHDPLGRHLLGVIGATRVVLAAFVGRH